MYVPIQVALSNNQLKALQKAKKDKESVGLFLSWESFDKNMNYDLYLTKRQVKKLQDNYDNKKGTNIYLSKKQIQSMKGGFLPGLSTALTGAVLKAAVINGLKAVAQNLAIGGLQALGSVAIGKAMGSGVEGGGADTNSKITLEFDKSDIDELKDIVGKITDHLPKGTKEMLHEQLSQNKGNAIPIVLGAVAEGKGLFLPNGGGLYLPGSEHTGGCCQCQKGNGLFDALRPRRNWLEPIYK